MYKSLKQRKVYSDFTKESLRYYLDKGYTFTFQYNKKINLYKDTSYEYHYRFSNGSGPSNPMQGAWTNKSYQVYSVPPTISFKALLCVH